MITINDLHGGCDRKTRCPAAPTSRAPLNCARVCSEHIVAQPAVINRPERGCGARRPRRRSRCRPGRGCCRTQRATPRPRAGLRIPSHSGGAGLWSRCRGAVCGVRGVPCGVRGTGTGARLGAARSRCWRGAGRRAGPGGAPTRARILPAPVRGAVPRTDPAGRGRHAGASEGPARTGEPCLS